MTMLWATRTWVWARRSWRGFGASRSRTWRRAGRPSASSSPPSPTSSKRPWYTPTQDRDKNIMTFRTINREATTVGTGRLLQKGALLQSNWSIDFLNSEFFHIWAKTYAFWSNLTVPVGYRFGAIYQSAHLTSITPHKWPSITPNTTFFERAMDYNAQLSKIFRYF